MNKVVDFLTLLFNIRTANNTEGYRRSFYSWASALLPFLKWGLFLLIGGTIIFLLFGLFTAVYFKERNTTQKLNRLAAVITRFQQTQTHLPANLDDLVANSPLVRDLTIDSWGNPILYEHNPANKTFLLHSGGKDQQLHTADDLVVVVQVNSL